MRKSPGTSYSRARPGVAPGRHLHHAYVAGVGQIDHVQVHPLEDWRAGLVDFAAQASREILLRFNWTDPAESMIRDWVTRLRERRL